MKKRALGGQHLVPMILALLLVSGLMVLPVAGQIHTPPSATDPKANPLVWDAMSKELTPKSGAETADFTFSVTNTSDSTVIVENAFGNCGCTTPKLPSKPWVLAPHTSGDMEVSVLLAGRSGDLFKNVTVNASNYPPQVLTLQVHLPADPGQMRAANVALATADRQAVFKGDCARCHVTPTAGKMSKDLFTAACGICHEAQPRATMVPDLRALNHSTDYNYWKVWIRDGKPGTLMPAFSNAQGGPLNDEQIESLATTLAKMIPPNPVAPTNAAMTLPGAAGVAHGPQANH
jgi:cytochrome c553